MLIGSHRQLTGESISGGTQVTTEVSWRWNAAYGLTFSTRMLFSLSGCANSALTIYIYLCRVNA